MARNRQHIAHRLLPRCLLLALAAGLLLAPVWVPAQTPAPADAEQAEPAPPPEFEPDPLRRRTPRGAVLGYIEAVAKEDYEKAAKYLDLGHVSAPARAERGPIIARELQALLDQRGSVQPGPLLSDKPTGDEGDELDPGVDKVGTYRWEGETVPITVTRTEDEDGAPVWLVSSETLKKMPRDVERQVEPPLDEKLPERLSEQKWGGVPVGHWLAMVLLIIASYLVAWLITALITGLIKLLWKGSRGRRQTKFIRAFALPVRLYIAVWLLVLSGQRLGISIVVRQYFSEATVVVAWVAVLLLAWRLVDAAAVIGEQRLQRKASAGGLSAIPFFRRTGKVLVVFIGAITILDTVGLEVTTWLAALGIGGLALALGAQKTVENLVGSVTVIFDQPIRVGDYCKVGETAGTIESIGMRSTRIRTLSRTLITIPNGEFSAQRIENYSYRDRFLFRWQLGLRYETTPDQLRYLLVELRSLLYAHPRVNPDPARVRFIGFGATSLNLDVFAYIDTVEYDDFLEVQEDLCLRIMEIVETSGTGFAFPSQTLYMARDSGLSAEKSAEAEARVREWSEKGELQLPKFDAERIDALRGTVPYPPEGSSARPRDSDLK